MIVKCLMIIKLSSHASNPILKNVIDKAGISRTCWMDLEVISSEIFKAVLLPFSSILSSIKYIHIYYKYEIYLVDVISRWIKEYFERIKITV